MTNSRHFFMVYCIGSGFALLASALNSTLPVFDQFLMLYLEHEMTKPMFVFMYFYALILGMLGIIAGVKLADQSAHAETLLFAYLLPQIPFVVMPGLAYYFKLGLDFTIYVIMNGMTSAISGVRLNFSIGSFFSLNNGTVAPQNLLLGVNIIPILLLASLVTVRTFRMIRTRPAAS